MRGISLIRYILVLLTLSLLSSCDNFDFTKKHSTEDEVMKDFFEAKDRAEDMLMDPLIVNSDLVKDRVIEEINDKNMDKRRYAIGYLGNEKINEALPALLSILGDVSEIDYFRADALESIYQIKPSTGLTEARKYINRSDYLGERAKSILNGTYKPFIRSLKDARKGIHN